MSDTNVLETLMNAMRRMGGRGKVDERAAAAKAASGQIAQRLPDALMPHAALQKQKEREAMLDAMVRQQ